MAVWNGFTGCYMTDIRGSKYLLIADIERCPYIPRDLGYDDWDKKDIERCAKIIEARKEMHMKANQLMSHEDRDIRNMAIFIDWFFNKE